MTDLRRVIAVLFWALPLGLLGATSDAADAPVRTGAEAFGDWKADAPGVRRLIRPQDLPEAYATGAAASRAELKPLPAGGPKLPPGFKAEIIAKDLRTPRVIRVAPDGTIFVAESGGRNDFAISEDGEYITGKGSVRALRLKPDGTTESARFAGDLARPYGIAFWPAANPQYVYVGETGRVVRYPYKPGSLTAAGPMEVVVAKIPTTERGHWTRDLAFSPDGKTLYIAVGSASNIADRGMPADPPDGLEAWKKSHPLGAAWGPEERRADVLAVDPDGKNLRVFATGLRNCAGMTVQPATGQLWCVVNERDGLGDNLPPDYATHVQAGKFYGWPWYYIGANEEPSLAGKRPDLKTQVTVPDVLIQPHSAPLNIVFYTGSQFPAEYRGDAFVAMHGSWNRDQRTGYKLIRLPMKDGKATGEYEDFLTGLVDANGGVLGRPVGIAVANDGSLLFSEDGNNTVWRITYSQKQATAQ